MSETILFYDTETTGKADFSTLASAAHQPRLVQLAAILADESGAEISSLKVPLAPIGYSIPPEATAIHGITTEFAAEHGSDKMTVLSLFQRMALRASRCCCHNADFDDFIMAIELGRLGFQTVTWQSFCTMKAMTPICELPGIYGQFKWPKLAEAYAHCFNRPLEKAHDAMADVRACKEIYFWLKERNLTEI